MAHKNGYSVHVTHRDSPYSEIIVKIALVTRKISSAHSSPFTSFRRGSDQDIRHQSFPKPTCIASVGASRVERCLKFRFVLRIVHSLGTWVAMAGE